jgi:hypothetical protein
MRNPSIEFFLKSAGVLLLATALAKLISAAGSARLLQIPDPVLNVPFRVLFCVVAGLEIVSAIWCFLDQNVKFRAGLVAWLGTCFVFYRVGLGWVGSQKHCPCLGTLTDSLHIPPETADFGLKVILGYLLIGSYASLLWLWKQNRAPLSDQPKERAVSPARFTS